MSDMDLAHERVLIKGRYEIERMLGRGTTGAVYLAWDHELAREVAVKVLHQDLVTNDEVTARFEVETRVTARLQHPGVVAVFDKAEVGAGNRCYIMSLAIGQTLGDYIQDLQDDGQPWKRASLIDRLTLFLRILDVVAYAHSQGVVHRDLKPENIVLGDHGEVRVLDWGLARSLREPEREVEAERFYDDVFGDESGIDGAEGTRRATQSERLPRERQSDIGTRRLSATEHGTRGTVTPHLTAEDETIISAALGDQAAALGAGSDRSDTPSRSTTEVEPQPQTGPVPSSALNRPDNEPTKPQVRGDRGSEVASDQGGSSTRRSASTTDRRASDPPTAATLRPDLPPSSVPARRGTDSHRRRSSGYGDAKSSRRRSSARISTATSERSTRFGAVLGSPAYMSPEQARGEANQADERADIYSLGCILFELLTGQTPTLRQEGEAIVRYIERVQNGDRRSLQEVWEEAPQELQVITEWALALDPQDRYADCEIFREELRILNVRLSENWAEMERLRMEREREGAWLRIGTWNYSAKPELEPFTEPVVAYDGEPIGQVLHPELGGVLVGGTGLQVYPVGAELADDIHFRMVASISRGHELRCYLRGLPPHPSYIVAFGAFAGNWMTVSRSGGDQSRTRPVLLAMLPMAQPLDGSERRIEIDIQVVGSAFSIVLDEQQRLEVRDPCPLIGPLHRQLAIASHDSQMVIHELAIDQRRSPLMVPSFHVANELLRQKLVPQAIDLFRRFLVEHQGADEAVEAHFMLCLAFRQAGHRKQAERELEIFLSRYIEEPLAQDAIFELARLKVEEDHRVDRAVRTVLSYQEADDQVRSRFCLWMMELLVEQVTQQGLVAQIEEDLRLLQHLISGFPDSDLIMQTLAEGLSEPLRDHGFHLLDREDHTALEHLLDAVQRCRLRGYDLQITGLRPLHWYEPLVRRMGELPANHPDYVGRVESLIGDACSIRDLLFLVTMGGADPLLRWLQAIPDPEPSERLLRAALAQRVGQREHASADLQVCFQLMDVLELERTSPEVTAVARLAFFALDYLPWGVVWEPVERLVGGDDLRALAAMVAECLGNHIESGQAYESINRIGTGYVAYARAGLERLGLG